MLVFDVDAANRASLLITSQLHKAINARVSPAFAYWMPKNWSNFSNRVFKSIKTVIFADRFDREVHNRAKKTARPSVQRKKSVRAHVYSGYYKFMKFNLLFAVYFWVLLKLRRNAVGKVEFPSINSSLVITSRRTLQSRLRQGTSCERTTREENAGNPHWFYDHRVSGIVRNTGDRLSLAFLDDCPWWSRDDNLWPVFRW